MSADWFILHFVAMMLSILILRVLTLIAMW